jgi:hypothetical protein
MNLLHLNTNGQLFKIVRICSVMGIVINISARGIVYNSNMCQKHIVLTSKRRENHVFIMKLGRREQFKNNHDHIDESSISCRIYVIYTKYQQPLVIRTI